MNTPKYLKTMNYTNTISEEYVASGILKQAEKVIPMLKADGFTEEYFHTGVSKIIWKSAIKMVDDLFKAPGAGQEVDANVFANDVVTAQTAEIGIMRRLLTQLPPK